MSPDLRRLAEISRKSSSDLQCLRGTRIVRVELDGRRVVTQENLLSGKYGVSAKWPTAPMVFFIFQLQTATDVDRRLLLMIESFDSYQLSDPRSLPHD